MNSSKYYTGLIATIIILFAAVIGSAAGLLFFSETKLDANPGGTIPDIIAQNTENRTSESEDEYPSTTSIPDGTKGSAEPSQPGSDESAGPDDTEPSGSGNAITDETTAQYETQPEPASQEPGPDEPTQPDAPEITAVSIRAEVTGSDYHIGDTLTGFDFNVFVTMSDGSTVVNPTGWAASPLELMNETNVVNVFYGSLSTQITVAAAVRATTPAAQPVDSGTTAKVGDRISIIAGGDNLVHYTYYTAAHDPVTDTYNFDSVFTEIAPYIRSADLALLNQEVPCAGREYGISTYPSFNCPHEAIDVMVNIGFDVMTTATNHALDKGYQGLVNTLDYIHTAHPQILTSGTFRSLEESVTVPVITVKGVKIAVLSYTYGTNGAPVKYDYSINLLSNTDKIAADLQRAKQVADFVIVCPHWGEEYHTNISDEQRLYAQYFADWGADLIIGAHPHVVQPFETVTANDGRVVPVFYSLGNFIAWQNDFPRAIGGLAKATLAVTDHGVVVEGYDLDFTYVNTINYGPDLFSFKVYPVRSLPLEEFAKYCMPKNAYSYEDVINFCYRMNPNWQR
ncbi:MAG: CapA family protein [Lachnospiraceae bacterium]|nr:CapA family protein [Lachnospiraceae bacterium]